VVDVEVTLKHRVDVVDPEAGSREVVVKPVVGRIVRIERLTEVVRPVARRGRVVNARVPEDLLEIWILVTVCRTGVALEQRVSVTQQSAPIDDVNLGINHRPRTGQ
jgi:hypothetical protein